MVINNQYRDPSESGRKRTRVFDASEIKMNTRLSSVCVAHSVSGVGEPVSCPARQRKASHPSEWLFE